MGHSVVDLQENDGVANITSDIMRLRRHGHFTFLGLSELKHQQNVKQVCLSCSVCVFE